MEPFERLQRDKNILRSLLVEATTKPDVLRLPTLKEYILSEVINGTLSCGGAEAGKLDYQNFIPDSSSIFEIKMYDYFINELEFCKGLDSNIQKTITNLVKPVQDYSNTPSNELYSLFSSYSDPICPVTQMPTFSIPYELVVNANKFLPSLSESERKTIEGIANAMRPIIVQDVESIKQRRNRQI